MNFSCVCSIVVLKKMFKGPVVNNSNCQHLLNQDDGNMNVYYSLKFSLYVLNIS